MLPSRPLGRTDLDVGPLVLGGSVFGWTIDEARSSAVLDAFAERGGRMIDTADSYADGESERIIGRWLASRGMRGRMLIATKVGCLDGLSAGEIERGILGSLERLGLDRVDLYFAHVDDRDTPLAETLGAFDAMVKRGLVRWLGGSNLAVTRLVEARALAADREWSRYEAIQPPYNALCRAAYEDGGLAEYCRTARVGVLAYAPLAGGFLTGKYRCEADIDKSPRAGEVRRYMNSDAWLRVDMLRRRADRLGGTPAQHALAWVLNQPGITAVVVSATSPEQVAELFGALDPVGRDA